MWDIRAIEHEIQRGRGYKGEEGNGRLGPRGANALFVEIVCVLIMGLLIRLGISGSKNHCFHYYILANTKFLYCLPIVTCKATEVNLG